ncbi:MAG: carbon storage regulator [Methylococcales bacterium]
MLVITQREGDQFMIGDDITIKILKDGSQIKIGIDAPIELGIERFSRDDFFDDE